MESGFSKADSSNLPMVDAIMVAGFFATNNDFCAAEFRNVKTSVSSRQSYGDDAIGYVQLKREGNICIVKCRICPEHKVHGKAYSATMIINEEEGKIISVECHDCAASQGGCKHAVAFLMWVHRRIEEPSCTSVECYWKKSQLAKVGTTLKFITTTELSRGRPKSTSLSDSRVLFKFLEEGKKRKLDTCQLMKYQENAEIRDVEMLSLHQLSFKYPEKCAEVFLQKVAHTFSDNILKKIENETRNQSKNSLWYELRYGRITASKAYEVSRCKTSDGTLYATIMGGKIPDTFAIKRGRTMEDVVRKLLEEKFERKIVKCGLFISKQYPMIAGSPDGISNESVIEIKCPLSLKTFHNYIKEGRIDKKFCAQIQLQMYLTKLKTGFFCVADPDFTNNQKVEIINVNFDKEYVDNLLDILSTFWKNNIYPLLYKNNL